MPVQGSVPWREEEFGIVYSRWGGEIDALLISYLFALARNTKQRVIIVKSVIVVAGDGYAMAKYATDLGEIMDAAEDVGLIENMLSRAEIGHEVESAAVLSGNRERVEVGLDYGFARVEVDALVAVRRIRKQVGCLPSLPFAEPLPNERLRPVAMELRHDRLEMTRRRSRDVLASYIQDAAPDRDV